uniref:Uncharacterized protein n=1 Tax=Arundo donax TaxID=35708 RepID=A0A0A9HLU1_ARUDO
MKMHQLEESTTAFSLLS